MVGFLVMLLVAAIIGFVAEAIAPGGMPGGWAGAIVAGLLGSAVGGYLFSGVVPAGATIAGFALLPSILGAIVVVLLFSLAARLMHSAR
jgi:uncharacterized membrane protein YeaQ/YmgE (transglycosylase-associated protein family)